MAPRALKIYRRLLRAFPRNFRARFGDDMADVFADRLRDARGRGPAALAALWASTIGDLASHATAERRLTRRGRRPTTGVIMTAFLEDLLSALRSHARRPAFALIVGSMLAVGLGFNTALFAVVHAVLLKPLPYHEPDRIAMLWTGRNPDGTGGVDSYADYIDWKARSHSFESLATYNISYATLTGSGDPEEIGGAVVSPEFFHVLGARLLLGRGIEPGDERIKVEDGRPIVIGANLWERHFSRDPGILGRTIVLAGRPRRVVGVMSPEFVQPEPFWGERTEYWSPLTVTDEMRTNHAFHYLRVIGRLNAGVSLARAGADMELVRLALAVGHTVADPKPIIVASLSDEMIGDTRPLTLVFLGAVSLVLSLAVANIVNLLLARANRRRAELAIRAALGASRMRLMSQLIAESVVLGLFGGVLGLGLAHLGIRVLLRYGPIRAPGIEDTALDFTVVAFATILSAATGAICGLLPAWRVARARLASAVGEMRGSTGLEASRARTWLVAAEMALALPLLVGAALLTRTLVHMQQVDLGFDAAQALQFRVTLSGARYSSPSGRDASVQFFKDLETRLLAEPGVTATGIVSSLPLGGLNNTGGSIVYEHADGTLGELGVGYRAATGGYFAALGIPLKRGRVFGWGAGDAGSIVVNDRAAAEMWGARDPLGRRLRFGTVGDAPGTNPWLTVIGVVGSFHHEALTRAPSAEVFQPYQATMWSTMTVVARTTGAAEALAPAARADVRTLDSSLAVVGLGPVAAFIDGQLAGPRFGVLSSVIFGAIGLMLAACGLFAVLSLLVAQRTREIGIRIALGSTPRRVATLLFRESLGPIAVGCGLGCVGAEILARALTSQLFGVTTSDPGAFGGSLCALLVVACLASWWPARRAMRVDPIAALRAG